MSFERFVLFFIFLERPKSLITKLDNFSSSNIFFNFKSRCRNYCSCKCYNPFTIYSAKFNFSNLFNLQLSLKVCSKLLEGKIILLKSHFNIGYTN